MGVEAAELFVNVKFCVQAFTDAVLNATLGEGEMENTLLVVAEQLWFVIAVNVTE